MGTVFNDLRLLRRTVDAVASLGVDVLVTSARALIPPMSGINRRTSASNAMYRRRPC